MRILVVEDERSMAGLLRQGPYAPFNVLLLAVFSLSGADWQVVFPVDKKKLRNVRKSHL